MSLSKNRIPADSVSFSDKKYRFDYEELSRLTENNHNEKSLTDEELIIQKRETELEKREQEALEMKEKLRLKEAEILEQEQNILKAQEEEKKILERERKEFENEKRRTYYEMKKFMWENSVSIAEELLNQKVSIEDFDMSSMFLGMLKKLPISFDELEITVHPDTVQMMEVDVKSSFVLKEVKWKYNYSLEIGDFIIEEEQEFYEVKISDIFQRIKDKTIEKIREEEVGDND